MKRELELVEYIGKFSFEFGILDSQGELKLDVNILNTDLTTTIKKMKVRDIMYFTEYGTLTIPGKRVLEKSALYINNLLDLEINKLIDEIFQTQIDEGYIRSQMERIAIKIKDYVRNYMELLIKKTNKLGVLLHKDTDNNRYLYNLADLSKYIECKLIFRN